MSEKPTYEKLEKKVKTLELKIAEQKQFEKALKSSERILSSTLESLDGLLVVIDSDRRVILSNWKDHDFVPEEDRQGYPHCYKIFKHLETPCDYCPPLDTFADGKPRIYEDRNPVDGSFKEIRVTPIMDEDGKVANVIEYVQDITKRKQAEELLKTSEEKFSSSFLYSNDAIVLSDSNGMIIDVNQKTINQFAYTKNEMLSFSIYDLHPKEALEKANKTFEEVFNRGFAKFEIDFVKKNKEIFPAEVSASLFEVADKKVIQNIIRDITKRRQSENALRESEEKYRQLIQNANDAIFIAQDGIIKFSNPVTEKLTGYSSKELSSISFIELIHPDDRNMVLNRHKRRLTGEELPSTYSFKIINKKDDVLWVQINAVVIQWDSHPATLNFLRNVTDLKRLEEQFLQAQKMEAVGTLAGGVAHDFNNILMGIQGRTSLMSINKNLTHDHREHIDAIEEYVQRATALTKQLLGFARGGKYTVNPLNINALILNSSSMFGRTKKEIRIHTKFQNSTLVVEADQSQIEQVLLNMYVNAWQAMPDGGELYLETKSVNLDDLFCRSHGVEPGRYVKVIVADTGIGMNSDTQQQIFDPFFTTKEKTRGTGLGLASAYGIIKNHGGMITVYSEVDNGTTFDIYLPASDKEVYREVPTKGQMISGSETILLVDDEDMIIDVGQAMLKKLGYRVIVSRIGIDAVETISEIGNEIDLVILDLIMPGIDGGEIFDRIRRIQPQIPILLASGYAINGQAGEIMKRGCNGFIQKPFSMSELSIQVREILDNKRRLPERP